MLRDDALTTLKRHEAELRTQGLRRLSLFGSTARDTASPGSDVDIAIQLDPDRSVDLFAYAAIAARLELLLGVSIDLVTEPSRSSRLQAMIDRDRIRVF